MFFCSLLRGEAKEGGTLNHTGFSETVSAIIGLNFGLHLDFFFSNIALKYYAFKNVAQFKMYKSLFVVSNVLLTRVCVRERKRENVCYI